MYREFFELFLNGYSGRRTALTLLLVTIAVSFLEIVNIGFLIPLLDTLQSSQDPAADHWISRLVSAWFRRLGVPFSLGSVLLSLSLVFTARQGLKYFRMSLVARTTADFVCWMRTQTFGLLLGTDLSYFHRQKLGVIVDTLTTQARKAGDAFYFVTEIFAVLAVLAGYFVAALLFSPSLTLIALIVLIAVTLFMQRNIGISKTWADRLVERSNLLQVTAVEYLSGVRVIKSFVIEREGRELFKRRASEFREATYRFERNQVQMAIAQETIVFVLAVGLIFTAILLFKLTPSVVLAFLVILLRLGPNVAYVNSRRHGLVSCMASLRSIKAVMDDVKKPRIVSGTVRFPGLRSKIQFEDVSFAYDGQETVLDRITLIIEKEKTTAIVGASGGGKSTLVDLLVRFYDPVKGRVTVDGRDLRDLDLDSWRKAIGVVSQDVFLFNDTVFNNIACGRHDATDTQVIEATRLAHAHEFVSQLPQGYQTEIGDRGVRLSGGERQRLALARALLRKPEILILDEATSALDSESERLIRDSLKRMQGTFTIVAIAHRLSTIEDADKIVVIEGGKIVEQGDRTSLLAEGGMFAKYYGLQLGQPLYERVAGELRGEPVDPKEV